ncbi:MAG: sigma-70 family RNA polymerase sigma factor [Armatimonas sp.]
MRERVEVDTPLSQILEQERPRLLRFFRRQCESLEQAEDLVQETLIEAWRNRHKLASGAISPGWVLGVARNVALRGRHRHIRERTRHSELPQDLPDKAESLEEPLVHGELTDLLDRALGLLPETTRTLLSARYLEEMPIAELAGRWKLSENAATVRLHRGRHQLQRTLLTHFPESAAAYGLASDTTTPWQQTPIWCANCGNHRLIGRLPEHGEGFFELRCPGCHIPPTINFRRADTIDGTLHYAQEHTGFHRILRTLDTVYYLRHQRLLRKGKVLCPSCGRHVPVVRSNPSALCPKLSARYGFHAYCRPCERFLFGESLGRYLMGLSELQKFWKRHPRMRRPPERDIEFQGIPAIEVNYESLTDSATLTVICRVEDLSVLQICR